MRHPVKARRDGRPLPYHRSARKEGYNVALGTDAKANTDGGLLDEAEREEILKEIEASVRPRRAVSETARRGGYRGAILPLAANAGALLLVALAAFIVPGLYDIDERRLVGEAGAGPAAAGELVRALRQEAEEQIQERDETIESLRGQYLQIRGERESLRRDFDRALGAKADELEAQMRAALDAERARLRISGADEAAVAARLGQIEAAMQAQRRAELETFAAGLRSATEERDRRLAEAQARYDDELRRRTDPLKAEIERMAARGSAQEAERRELEARYQALRLEFDKAAAERSAETASLSAALREAKAQLERLEAREGGRLARLERLDALLRSYAAATSRPLTPAAQAALQATALELLQAKVDTRALLAADPVRSGNPGLGERLDRYFEYFESEYRRQGRAAALSEAIELVDSLVARREPRGLAAGDAELRRFMETLRSILR